MSLVNTILDMQPCVSGSTGGKSSDDIVYDLAESIKEKLPDKLDMDEARQDMFDVSINNINIGTAQLQLFINDIFCRRRCTFCFWS